MIARGSLATALVKHHILTLGYLGIEVSKRHMSGDVYAVVLYVCLSHSQQAYWPLCWEMIFRKDQRRDEASSSLEQMCMRLLK